MLLWGSLEPSWPPLEHLWGPSQRPRGAILGPSWNRRGCLSGPSWSSVCGRIQLRAVVGDLAQACSLVRVLLLCAPTRYHCRAVRSPVSMASPVTPEGPPPDWKGVTEPNLPETVAEEDAMMAHARGLTDEQGGPSAHDDTDSANAQDEKGVPCAIDNVTPQPPTTTRTTPPQTRKQVLRHSYSDLSSVPCAVNVQAVFRDMVNGSGDFIVPEEFEVHRCVKRRLNITFTVEEEWVSDSD